MSITMAHLLEVDIEKTLIFQGITLDIIGRCGKCYLEDIKNPSWYLDVALAMDLMIQTDKKIMFE